MCDFLYGAVSKKDYTKKFITKSLEYNIPVTYTLESCTLFPLNKSNNDYIFFRLTNEYCDCSTPLGYGSDNLQSEYLNVPKKRELFLNSIHNIIDNYINWLNELKHLCCISNIYLLKHFDDNKPEKACTKYTVHVDDINREFLINLENELAYKIQFYRKYY
ncbi:hypothetical protein [Terrisporobacter petrolearius]|uniref:hypothetical protein n=1 Tax=Terrisporobacter petrolearius TaxID=1460447 RepID=UPI0031CCD823